MALNISINFTENISPHSFEGFYAFTGIGADIKSGIGLGGNFKYALGSEWITLSAGASFGIGLEERINFFGGSGGVGKSGIINEIKPTSERSSVDKGLNIIANPVLHSAAQIINWFY